MLFSLSFPLERPHCGIPLANGNFGILLWGSERLHFTVNRSDFWSHRNGCNIPEYLAYKEIRKSAADSTWVEEVKKKCAAYDWPLSLPHRLAMGRFELYFAPGVVPQSAHFDPESSTAVIHLSNGAKLTVDLLRRSSSCRIYDPDRAVAGFYCLPSWDFAEAQADLKNCGCIPPERFPDGWDFQLPDEEKTLHCRIAGRGENWFISALYDTDAEEIFPDEKSVQKSRLQWRKDWETLPRITSGEPFWDEFYQLSVNKLLAATLPGGYVSGLQGPWVEDDRPCPWCGDLHFNVNVQMIYGALLRLGKYENMLPLFDRIESPEFQENLRINALRLTGTDDGWYFTHAVDDRGAQCGGISAGACLDPACGIWLALLYYDYWRFTGDEKFLKERAFPAVKKVLHPLFALLDENYEIPFAISAEYGASNPLGDPGGRNPSSQLAFFRKCAVIAVEMAEFLGEKAEPQWLEMLEKMPQWCVVSGFDRFSGREEERIGIWEGQDLNCCHRHHSHLSCIWPCETFPVEPDEKEKNLLHNTIDRWIAMGMGDWSEWAMLWAVMLDARLGFPEAAAMHLELFRNIFLNESLCPVYYPRHRGITMHCRHNIASGVPSKEIMQLDGSAGFISAYTDLFVHQHGDVVELLKGVPAKWRKSFQVSNVPLRGNFRISIDPESFTVSGGKDGATLPVRTADGKIKYFTVGQWQLSALMAD